MTKYLLDTNVLIAVLDRDHPFHLPTSRWFSAASYLHWLTCPITENGAARIISLKSYSAPRPVHEVVDALRTLTEVGRHEHIPDDVSLLGPDIQPRRIRGSSQVTDSYLALLAHKHGAKLATLDRRISAAALKVPAQIEQIPT